MNDQVEFILDETQIPKSWYNLVADLPEPLPPVLHPGTKQPVGPADLEPLFAMALILQEVSAERTIDIPEPIREVQDQMARWQVASSYQPGRTWAAAGGSVAPGSAFVSGVFDLLYRWLAEGYAASFEERTVVRVSL